MATVKNEYPRGVSRKRTKRECDFIVTPCEVGTPEGGYKQEADLIFFVGSERDRVLEFTLSRAECANLAGLLARASGFFATCDEEKTSKTKDV